MFLSSKVRLSNFAGVLMSDEKENHEKLTSKLLELEEEISSLNDDLEIWTDALEELAEIEDAFKTTEKASEKPAIHGKTILDVGTDAVKPLYIALRLNPNKIIGINEDFRGFEANLELKAKILADTKIGLYSCSLFDEATFERIRVKEDIRGKFDFVLVSKTLHHLRTDKCVEEHECPEDEKSCMYRFNSEYIFNKLLSLGERVIVYESFDATEPDKDKIRGRGGYLGKNGLLQVFKELMKNEEYRVQFVRPRFFRLDETNSDGIEQVLREVDCVCFYVEKASDIKPKE
jgi:hypothetical protein